MEHLLEVNAVARTNRLSLGGGIDLVIIDFPDSIGAEHLHATGTRHGGAGDEFHISPSEQAAEIDFGMEHVLSPRIAIFPERWIRIVAGSETVVGRSNDAVVEVDRHSTDFAKRILRSQAGDMRERHCVFRDGEAPIEGRVFHE